jgi:hypothetical protein
MLDLYATFIYIMAKWIAVLFTIQEVTVLLLTKVSDTLTKDFTDYTLSKKKLPG